MVEEGTKVRVHYDVKYRGIDVVSSRQSRLLGGNRWVMAPFCHASAGCHVR